MPYTNVITNMQRSYGFVVTFVATGGTEVGAS